MFLPDTDAVSLAFREHVRVLSRMAAVEAPVGVTIVTRLEILRGRIDAVLKAATPDELLRAQDGLIRSEKFLAGFTTVYFDDRSAGHFERLRDNKKFKRRRSDLLIACIALAHDATLVTRNVKDFRNIPGLRVEDWAD
jgi:tRNA(fMet)-specific endonuclease VapC